MWGKIKKRQEAEAYPARDRLASVLGIDVSSVSLKHEETEANAAAHRSASILGLVSEEHGAGVSLDDDALFRATGLSQEGENERGVASAKQISAKPPASGVMPTISARGSFGADVDPQRSPVGGTREALT